ncbi:MAG: ThuA domain-containing protein [Thermoguttaceae bacterium]
MFIRLFTFVAVFLLVVVSSRGDDAWATFTGSAGKVASGKKIVLVAADNEYRAEEGLTQLAQILATHHGFDCTVLYAVNPQTGEVDPTYNENIPGLEKLADADALVIWARFRNLPDEQMRFIDEYLLAGRPVMGLRTSTHAFNIPRDRVYSRYSFDSQAANWEQGFGRLVLGETWINHHGHHGFEATRGVIAADKKQSPLVRGCDDIFGPTDVYTVRLPLPDGCDVLVYGEVLSGMSRDDAPVAEKNDPMMPIAWTRTYKLPDGGKPGRAYTTTLGSAVDFSSEGVRRLAVAGVYWLVGLEDKIPEHLDVSIVGTYEPSPMGNDRHRRGIKPNQMR